MEGLQLSIPRSGVIPRRPTDFRVSLPCTGLKAGIANFKLVFEVRDQAGQPLEGSPIRLKLGKYCRLQNETCLVQKCAHGGVCTPYGDCLCQKGYVGRRCEHSAKCRNDCHRRGVCLRDDVCKCRPGFKGKYCQRRGRSRDGGKKASKEGRGGKRKGGKKGKKGGKKVMEEEEEEEKMTTTTTMEPDVTNEVESRSYAAVTPSYAHTKQREMMEEEEMEEENVVEKEKEGKSGGGGSEEKMRKRKHRRRQRKRKDRNNVTSPSKLR